jgi:hypothetical protein
VYFVVGVIVRVVVAAIATALLYLGSSHHPINRDEKHIILLHTLSKLYCDKFIVSSFLDGQN